MQTEDAYRLRDALAEHGVEYMIIGKAALILQGFPGTTQDIDIFPSKETGNPDRLLEALKTLGFDFDLTLEGSLHHSSEEVLRGKDFVQLKNGPFQLDIVYAPDGIESYEEAKKCKRIVEGFPIIDVDGVIQMKKATGRARDKEELPRIQLFRDRLRRKERGEL
ncbi:MAG: hypothetical protein KC940_07755 [Candidatus Omnitrophica bacterium]|nr:hypothetical protein [Candidatus Omnitrophota bacterium]MCA9426568.1 hypothetical protein [Candidatus Omnitrophota bacterium]MCA9430385.1 hypothetical protein [Candidatus Omnitrophota bacterium]MCA9435753.1 hypothetical protein [Candidatus Omnitrophota bacterium]